MNPMGALGSMGMLISVGMPAMPVQISLSAVLVASG
jgi:hypothetical protein